MSRFAEIPDWEGLVSQQNRPTGRAVMKQRWQNLLFAHAPVAGAVLEPFIPPGLELELFDGMAWLGFVPFQMQRVRPAALPFRWLSRSFLETNLRTYVRHPKYGPGVWFFSLDASLWPACYIARKQFSLPYYFGAMFFEQSLKGIYYAGTRQKVQRLPLVYPKPLGLDTYDVQFKPVGAPEPAKENSFDFWLLERYRLYAADYRGNLTTARVHHAPYQVQNVDIRELKLTGIQPFDPEFSHIRFCEGVDIEAFAPHRV